MLSQKFRLALPRCALGRAVSSALPLYTLASSALGQPQSGFEEVIVTASRREAPVQELPLNISAVSGEMIGSLRLDGISRLAYYVPGLTVIDRGPRDEVPDILVRGLNTNGLGPGFVADTVASYFGEIPLQLDIKPVDLERVEVLIGPQGTLYGQGTMGGAIRYLPVLADLDTRALTLRGDSSRNSQSEGPGHNLGVTVNLPLVEDSLALRMNLDRLYDPGFIDYGYVVRTPGVSTPEPDFNNPDEVAANLQYIPDANGEDTVYGRLNLRWRPHPRLETNLWYLHQDTAAEGRQRSDRLSMGAGRYTAANRYLEPNHYRNTLLSLEAKVDLAFAEATLVYGETDYREAGQRDQTDLLLNFGFGYELFPEFSSYTREDVDQDSDTLELRLASQQTGPLSWVAGYFGNRVNSAAVSKEFVPGFDRFAVDALGGIQLRPDALEYIQLTSQYQKEQALYGELAVDLGSRITATVGARHYRFEVDSSSGFGLPLSGTVFDGKPQDSIDVDIGYNQGEDQGNLYKFNLAWHLADSGLAYLTWSQGYRNGGINTVPVCNEEQIQSTTQQLCALPDEVLIKPDRIDNWELGVKTSVDDWLNVNLALYYIDWEDLQVSTTTKNGNLPITGNGSTARSRGLEAQVRMLLDYRLEAAFTYAYTAAELTSRAPGLVGPLDALAGARLPGHAEHQGSLNISWNTLWHGYDLNFNYGLVYSSNFFNIVGGDQDPLVDAANNDAPASRGGEALPGYAVQHLSATLAGARWTMQAYADNLFDKYYLTGTAGTRRFLADAQTGPGRQINGWTLRSYGQYVGTPRTLGLRLSYRF